jgi:hypothetical protein
MKLGLLAFDDQNVRPGARHDMIQLRHFLRCFDDLDILLLPERGNDDVA